MGAIEDTETGNRHTEGGTTMKDSLFVDTLMVIGAMVVVALLLVGFITILTTLLRGLLG